MLPPDPREPGDWPEAPEWFEAVGEFLRAWSQVERFGVDAWLRLEGAEEPDAWFGEALGIYAGELERRRAWSDAEDARRRRAEMEAAKAKRGA